VPGAELALGALSPPWLNQRLDEEVILTKPTEAQSGNWLHSFQLFQKIGLI
jgi:hypothetical protein